MSLLVWVSLSDVTEQGHWSQALIFQNFYRKNIKEYVSSFQLGIHNKQL